MTSQSIDLVLTFLQRKTRNNELFLTHNNYTELYNEFAGNNNYLSMHVF